MMNTLIIVFVVLVFVAIHTYVVAKITIWAYTKGKEQGKKLIPGVSEVIGEIKDIRERIDQFKQDHKERKEIEKGEFNEWEC